MGARIEGIGTPLQISVYRHCGGEFTIGSISLVVSSGAVVTGVRSGLKYRSGTPGDRWQVFTAWVSVDQEGVDIVVPAKQDLKVVSDLDGPFQRSRRMCAGFPTVG
jgi:hypothetical protein